MGHARLPAMPSAKPGGGPASDDAASSPVTAAAEALLESATEKEVEHLEREAKRIDEMVQAFGQKAREMDKIQGAWTWTRKLAGLRVLVAW